MERSVRWTHPVSEVKGQQMFLFQSEKLTTGQSEG